MTQVGPDYAGWLLKGGSGALQEAGSAARKLVAVGSSG